MYLFGNPSSDIARIQQLWKITYITNGGYYNISPMHKVDMVLSYNSSISENAFIRTIGHSVSLDTMPSDVRWSIESTDNGYTIRYGEDALTPTNGAVSPGLGVTTGTYSESSNNYHWTLTKISDAPGKLFLYNTLTNGIASSTTTRTVPAGAVQTLSVLNLAVSVCDLMNSVQTVNWRSSTPSVASVDLFSGTVTAHSPGQTTITVSRVIDDITQTSQYTLFVVEGISIVNYYDATLVNNSIALDYMDDAVAFVNRVYGDAFGIYFVADGSPERYTSSPVDICPYGADSGCNSTSTCGNVCENHHKNIFRISDELQAANEEDHVYVLWGDSSPGIYCNSVNGTCTPIASNVLAMVCNRSNAVQFFQLEADPTKLKEYMSLVLAHEIAHTLGVGDPDKNTHCTDDGYQCLLELYHSGDVGRFYKNILGGVTASISPFCSDCENALNDKIASYSYINNQSEEVSSDA